MAVWFVLILIIYIFFRQELTKWATQSFEKHPYLMLMLLLIVLSYFSWEKYGHLMSIVQFIYYNIQKMQNFVAHELQDHLKHAQSVYTFNVLIRAVLFGFLLYFPEFYRNKYPSFVYKDQVGMVKRVCYFILLILVLIFSLLE